MGRDEEFVITEAIKFHNEEFNMLWELDDYGGADMHYRIEKLLRSIRDGIKSSRGESVWGSDREDGEEVREEE